MEQVIQRCLSTLFLAPESNHYILHPIPYFERIMRTDHHTRKDVLDDVLRGESKNRTDDRGSSEQRAPNRLYARQRGNDQDNKSEDDRDGQYMM